MSDDPVKKHRKREIGAPPVVVVSANAESKYPSINSGNAKPSAPPAQVSASTVNSPEWIEAKEKADRKERKERKEKKEKKEKKDSKPRPSDSEKEEKKKHKSKTPKEAPQVRRDREAEVTRHARENPRVSPKDAESVNRRKAAKMKGVAESSLSVAKYPKRVEWVSRNATINSISFLVLAAMMSLLGVMIYANLVIDVKVPLYDSTDTTMRANGTEPLLIQTLLNMPERPNFECGSFDRSVEITNSSVVGKELGVTLREPILNYGYDCANQTNRIGFCVRDDTCLIIKDSIAEPPANQSYCVYPTGPRLYNTVYIASTFVEILNDNPLVAIVPIAIFMFVAFAWALAAAGAPEKAPQWLSIVGVLGMIIVFIAAILLESTNIWIAIYAGFVAVLGLYFKAYLVRVGNILKIGSFVMSGVSVDGVVRASDYQKNSLAIIAPAYVTIFIQAVFSLSLLFLAAAVPFITEWSSSTFTNTVFLWADRWRQYGEAVAANLSWNLYDPSDPDPPTNPDALKLGLLDCQFNDITSLNVAVIIFAIVYPFVSNYYEYAVKFLVNCSIADWYWYGTRHHKPPSSGMTNVGIAGFKRAMLRCGNKIFPAAFWGTLASSSASTLGGWKAFLTHALVSPIDAILYSFVGLLFRGLCKFHSRFGLVHASMFSGQLPGTETCNRASFALVRKTYGLQFAQVGDSPESRLLFIFGSFASLAVGVGSWIWVDYIQEFDSAAYIGGGTLLVLWLVASAIQKPGIVFMVALLVDTQYDWVSILNLEEQMVKNGLVALILVSAIANTIMRMCIQISASAVDSTVYCFAIEESKRRKIRSVKLHELIHLHYLGDSTRVPAGHTLEKVAIVAPANAVSGMKIRVQVEGNSYDVALPGGVRPGHEFEIAIAIPMNRVDLDESSSEYDSDENSAGVVRNVTKPAASDPITNMVDSAVPTVIQSSGIPRTSPVVRNPVVVDDSQRTVRQD